MNKGSNNRRSRSRGGGRRGGGGGRNQTFESNGPDVKVRGTAQQVLEKYLTLARDATSSGDRIAAEAYFQHAEHYFRIINADGENKNRHNGRDQQTPASEGAPPHEQPQEQLSEPAALAAAAAQKSNGKNKSDPDAAPQEAGAEDAPSEDVAEEAAAEEATVEKTNEPSASDDEAEAAQA